nr:hypothetical protein [uncultured Desulfuromonas sp.]
MDTSSKKTWVLAVYIVALLAMTVATLCWFNKITFGALFILIALWPVGQFFLNRKR